MNGNAKFDFNAKEFEIFLADDFYSVYELKFTTIVEEPLTEFKVNDTSSIILFRECYEIFCDSDCTKFNANEVQNITIVIRRVNGDYIKNTKLPVRLIYKEVVNPRYPWNSIWSEPNPPQLPVIKGQILEFVGYLNASGHVVVEVTLPDLEEFEHFEHFFNMKVKIIEETKTLNEVHQNRKNVKLSNTFPLEEPTLEEWFDVKLLPKNDHSAFELNDNITVNINSSEPLEYFDYILVGRGNIFKTQHVDLCSEKTKIYNLTFRAEFPLCPKGKIYVFYINQTNHYISKEIEFHINVQLQNQITVTASEQFKPGEEVVIEIKTTPHSFVGLMAVDQSVLMRSRNNDFQVVNVGKILNSYDNCEVWRPDYLPGETIGLVTLTNANYKSSYDITHLKFETNCRVSSYYIFRDKIMIQQPNNLKGFRKKLAETWIFANIEE